MPSHALAKLTVSFLVVFFLLTFTSSAARAQTFTDPGFISELVTTLPVYKPVGLTFAPDGRMFIWQENGIVRIFKNGVLLPTPFLDISAHVNSLNDRGLMGLALDPNFATNGYVYLYYSYEPNGNPNDISPKTLRLARVKADSANPDVALASSETVLLGSSTTAPCAANTDCISSDSDSHIGGTVRFGLDGKLYLSTGDGASYSFEDPLALRAQSLNSLNGKLIRLNADGTAPSDNPFYDGTNSVKSKIYAYGLRNPYRFVIHPTTGEVLIGDVGWAAYEEVNRGRGANFGWPCFEGDSPQPNYQAAFPATCGPIPASSITKPIYFYSHTEGQAIIGGPVYSATQFPVTYRGNYFFADYPSQWIKRMVFDTSGNVSNVQPFAASTGGIVSLEQGRDGALYYIVLETGQIRRIRFASAPTATASARPTTGASPLAVSFSSAGSSDPNNLALTYLWDFGDGTTSTQTNPVHTYTSATFTSFTARLTVTNSNNGTASATVTVTVGNRAPVATITAPANGFVTRPGNTVTYTGTATDPDETLSASAMSWQLLLHHDDHVHPFQTVTGTSGSFIAENHGAGTFYYEILLTVTDTRGATNTKSVNVYVDTTGVAGTTYLSDLNWTSALSGWGPVEKDRSNGEEGATDGNTITLNGVTYQKGLGVHASSDVRFALNGAYKTFAANVGVDDEVGSNGSVLFQVYADGTLLYDSGILFGSSATKQVNVDVTGKNELRLVVTTGGDNDWYDHADWANARLLSGSAPNNPPTVSLIAPANNATFVAPATITLTANAADSDGTISKVEFYQGAIQLGAATTSPYTFTWNNVGPGSYSFAARALDNTGAPTTSNEVKITVTAAANAAPSASITSPANNSTFTAPASITINANAADSDGSIAKVEFFNGATLLGTDTTAPYSFSWANVAAGNYALTVKATDDRGAVTTSSVVNLTVSVPANGLPAPWQKQDVGAVGVAGDASFANGLFTLKGSGADIWDFSDNFHFVWQPLAGDGEIIARVVGVQNTDVWAKAGVMIRSSLAANAPYAAIVVTPSRGTTYQWRYFLNGNSGSRTNSSLSAPTWVRLVRQGDNLTGYTSANGVTWNLLQVQTIPNLPGTVYIGLAVTSHSNATLCTATLDNVSVK